MTHEEIREVLARREPWNAVQRTVTRGEPMASSTDWSHAIATFCDEQARTLAQALVGEQDERDAAVRELLVMGLLHEEPDAALTDLWRDLRDDASHARVREFLVCVRLLQRTGALTPERAELWTLRIEKCPGHDDEGGRDWCAYGCPMPMVGK